MDCNTAEKDEEWEGGAYETSTNGTLFSQDRLNREFIEDQEAFVPDDAPVFIEPVKTRRHLLKPFMVFGGLSLVLTAAFSFAGTWLMSTRRTPAHVQKIDIPALAGESEHTKPIEVLKLQKAWEGEDAGTTSESSDLVEVNTTISDLPLDTTKVYKLYIQPNYPCRIHIPCSDTRFRLGNPEKFEVQAEPGSKRDRSSDYFIEAVREERQWLQGGESNLFVILPGGETVLFHLVCDPAKPGGAELVRFHFQPESEKPQ